MKKLLIILIGTVFILSGCQKVSDDPVNQPVYQGKWAGLLSYNLDDQQISIPSKRTIKDNVSVWWVVPECKSDFYLVNGVYSVHATLTDSSECRGVKYKWVFTWTGEGALENDTLIESGMLDYRYYTDGQLTINSTGRWICKLERAL